MCGIVAAITKKTDLPLERMIDSIRHRGPDDRGCFSVHSKEHTVYLGHQRLSILDLSQAGHQPMTIGSLTITYNGELYNFPELKKELEALGHVFRTRTDTEVIVLSYRQWGENCVKKFNGMFALAIWDANEEKLFVSRDHAGQKPLYFTELPNNGGIVCASEIKALLASGLIEPRVNTSALSGYLAYLRVHAPDTMFKGIYKLEPAHSLVWRNGRYSIQEWWSPIGRRSFAGSFKEACDELDSIFKRALARHLLSDVPIGAFLSGGLDSSLITFLARLKTSSPLSTLTTGYSIKDQQLERSKKNELTFARMLRDRLGSSINYQEIILQPDILTILPKMIWHLDEPIADPAEMNAFLICQEAHNRGITVLLSGMGCDEIFAGYNHHRVAWHTRSIAIPRPLLSSMLTLARKVEKVKSPLSQYASYFTRKGQFLSLDEPERTIGLSSWLVSQEVQKLLAPDVYMATYSRSKQRHFDEYQDHDRLTRLLYMDFKTFLAEHNLMYTDKMGMASSCEVRSPFLDRECVEFAFSLPSSFKIRGSHGKYIVKKTAERYLPSELVYQKKSGFSAPLRAWTAEIQKMSAELLSPNALAMQYFDTDTVSRLVSQDRSQKDDYTVWSLITFSLWHSIFIENKTF